MLATHSAASERPAPQLRTWGMWPSDSPASPLEAPQTDKDPSTWPRSVNVPFAPDLVAPALLDTQSAFAWGTSASGAFSTQDALPEAGSSPAYLSHTMRPPFRAMTDSQIDSANAAFLDNSTRNQDAAGEPTFWRPAATEPPSPDAVSLASSQTPSPASTHGPGWRPAHYSHDELLHRAVPLASRFYEQERPNATPVARWDSNTTVESSVNGQMASLGAAWNDASSEEPFSPSADASDGRLAYCQSGSAPRRMTESDFRVPEERYRSSNADDRAATAGLEYRASDAGLSHASSSPSGLPHPHMNDRAANTVPSHNETMLHPNSHQYQGLGVYYAATMPSSVVSASTGWSTSGQASYVPSSHGPTVPSSTSHFSNNFGGLGPQAWPSSSFGGMGYSTGPYSSIYPYFPIVKHRRRTTKEQFIKLEGQFRENPKPSSAVRKALSKQVGMTDRAVQIWFQNRRAKAKALAKKQAAGDTAKKGGPSQGPSASASTPSAHHPSAAHDEGRPAAQSTPATLSPALRTRTPLAPTPEPGPSPYLRFQESIYRRRT